MRDLPRLDQIATLPKTWEAVIPAEYLDEMGHMNVMWYTHLYSQAMRGLWERLGIDRTYIETNRAGTFALEKHVRYFAEVRAGEAAQVYSRFVGRNGSRFHVVQFMVNETKQRLASTMETVGTHVDLTIRRSSPLPPEIASALDALIEEHGTLDWRPPLCGVMAP